MQTITIVLLSLMTVSTGYIAFIFSKKHDTRALDEKIQSLENEKSRILEEKIRLESELSSKSEELGKLNAEIKNIASERDELSGKNKTLFIEKTSLVNDRGNMENENRSLKDRITKHEAEEARKQKEFEEQIRKLDESKKTLDEEKIRIQREDAEEQKKLFDEKDRIWNDHENLTLARLREACQRPSIGFSFYDNTNLPSDFTKLKPDFMIDFLEQYIVFDAKKSKDIRNYISEQVKSTAKKYKNISEIYPAVFFVVPQDEIQELKALSFTEDRFTFHVITVDIIEPLLANFKKVTEYERIEELDPQDRENIVTLIAHYDRHISLQNAANIYLAKESIDLMNKKESLNEKLLAEIDIKKQGMRISKLKDSDLKKIAQSLSEQSREIEKLVSPNVTVKDQEIQEVEAIFRN